MEENTAGAPLRAIVTGANSGLGFQVAAELARRGAQVVLACRNEGRGSAAAATLRSLTGSLTVESRRLDLADLGSVRHFADSYAGPLDLLVNNAGVMATPRSLTVDGFEQQLGVNHLGHFALTGLLLGQLRQSAAPRVVSVSSIAHRRGRIERSDLQSERGYRRWRAYSQSKLANLLFTLELDRRARAAGWPLTAAAAHPGLARTNLGAGMNLPPGLNVFGVLGRLAGQSDDDGALPILRAALDAEVRGGDYYGPGGPGGIRGAPTLVAPAVRVLDPDTAAWLWERSCTLTGVDYAALAEPSGPDSSAPGVR